MTEQNSNLSLGKLALIGFGPGDHDHITFRAKEAIAESEIVIGYRTYIHLVQELIDGKQVIYTGMTEELARARKAIDLAYEGKKVALISSGDVGIYGMAGPCFELLKEKGWMPGKDIAVEIVPGVTALTSCASVLGAPLMHDFCSISLSDLLTPWDVIRERIEAAAKADFVIALYNPKSGRRTRQIQETQKILLKYRSPETPVGLVKSCKRDMEQIVVTTLAEMLQHEIGMLTTVIIGNTNSYRYLDFIVTPRGYKNKYDLNTSSVKEGQSRGISLRTDILDSPYKRVEEIAVKNASIPSFPRTPESSWGTLYGIGVGPGDSKLLTVRAVEILSKVENIFYPSSSGTDESMALNIIEPYLKEGVKFHTLFFPMTKDRKELENHWNMAAEKVISVLSQGQDAVFVTLGDPMIYSTYFYLLKTLKIKAPDLVWETIPGISSYQFAASAMDSAISEGKDRVAFVPVNRDASNVEDALDNYDTIVLFKVGSKLPKVLEILESKGLLEQGALFSYLGTPEQTIERDLRTVKREKIGYMSLLIVKKKRVLSV
ncbi:MAG: precorrin-3B C(17)-methyltransferase, partial [Elusimicrobia bacterium]|nr:precorrin-3B C(17)-methyltransferase [Elusimicrobiota bacterium]